MREIHGLHGWTRITRMGTEGTERHGLTRITQALLLVFLLFMIIPAGAEEEESPREAPTRSLREQQLDILYYGTATEITALIQTLRNERASYLDDDLVRAVNDNLITNRNVLRMLFDFFRETEKPGLEDRAIRAIEDRDYEAIDVVSSAVSYLGVVRAHEAIEPLKDLVSGRESRFLISAIQALGRVAGGSESRGPQSAEQADEVALFLLDFFENHRTEENRNVIVTALGDTGSPEGVSFLAGIINNADEGQSLRISALGAIAKIQSFSEIPGNEGVDAVIEAVFSRENAVRSAAVAALGPFSGDSVDNAILDAIRDDEWSVRRGAVQAAEQRRLVRAIPLLRQRAENDADPQVRILAIRALGAINTRETVEILDGFFSNRRNNDRLRLTAAEMLVQHQGDEYVPKVIAEMEEARRTEADPNRNPLYNGFLLILSTARSSSLESLARRFIEGGGVIERLYGLDMVMSNEFRGLADEVRALLDEERYGLSTSRRAQRTLESMGLD